jgi:hypothetical protein
MSVARSAVTVFSRLVRMVLGCALAAGGAASRAQQPAPDSGAADVSGMPALYGPYDMSREASGTSWQPDSTPMGGIDHMSGPWMTMVHAFVYAIYDDQGGPRGATQTFSTSMLMLMARRQLSEGALGLRLMLSGDPLMGREGYPLLFQTGETANGVVPLIDRQHPHDLLMEASASYSLDLSAHSSAFVHHWLDSTHVAWGVVTGGYTAGPLKLEASAFNGHEPNQNHYDIETGALDSYAARVSYNPTRDWSLQASTGHLIAPEQLEPNVNVQRTTASATYNAPLGLYWQSTFAFGRDVPSSGEASNAWLLESQLHPSPAHTFFARLERVGKDDLFLPGAALYGRLFSIEKLSVGYVYDFAHWDALNLGVGGLVSTYSFTSVLNSSYGYRPTSFMVFMRARL